MNQAYKSYIEAIKESSGARNITLILDKHVCLCYKTLLWKCFFIQR